LAFGLKATACAFTAGQPDIADIFVWLELLTDTEDLLHDGYRRPLVRRLHER
jgi:hypothetical protein